MEKPFFLIHLLYLHHWRSDNDILGGATSYRDKLFSLYPTLYGRILRGQDERAQASNLALGREYLEIVERVSESMPRGIQDMVSAQLHQSRS
jgi:hypothetical protein